MSSRSMGKPESTTVMVRPIVLLKISGRARWEAVCCGMTRTDTIRKTTRGVLRFAQCYLYMSGQTFIGASPARLSASGSRSVGPGADNGIQLGPGLRTLGRACKRSRCRAAAPQTNRWPRSPGIGPSRIFGPHRSCRTPICRSISRLIARMSLRTAECASCVP